MTKTHTIPQVHLSDDEERLITYVAWRAKAETNVDAQIAMDILVEHLKEGRHQSWWG